MPLQTPDEAMACARRGAALLDLVEPGWDLGINPVNVRLHDYCGCVMAHYGGGANPTMSKGLARLQERCTGLGLDISLSHQFGFSVDAGLENCSLAYWYAPLQRAWEIIFAERRATREAS